MIVRSNPATEIARADMAWFDSDAAENDRAIREIDAGAARYGLVRTREYWLQSFAMPDRWVVRRGFCYRPETSDLADRVTARRGAAVAGATAAEIVRQAR